jgi:hypothetical protein
MKAMRITAGEPTAGEARAVLTRLFPDAATYEVRQADGRTVAVSFSAAVRDAADPLPIWQALFPGPGEYQIDDGTLHKAIAPETAGLQFDEWWLERLLLEARRQFTGIHDLVLGAIERFIREHAGGLADPEHLRELEELLFDLRQGIRWSVAAPVPADTVARLRILGFSDRDVLDFAGIAYRLGLIELRLQRPGARFDWAEVLALARQAPTLHSDEVAMAVARQRAGMGLTPVLLRDGQALTLAAAEEERRLLRELTARAIAEEMHPRDFARQLYKRLELDHGIVRDWERVARTEIMEARLRGAFEGERRARQWTAETLVYRQVAARPCSGCLRLYQQPDGMPHRYTVAELEAEDARGFNRGPWREWRPRIGPTHPHCLCGPWATWSPALQGVFAREAPRWRQTMAARGLITEGEQA